MLDLLSLDEKDMTEILQTNGFPAFRGKQLFQWSQEKEVKNFDAMKNLPGNLKLWLKDNMKIGQGIEVSTLISDDKSTVKFLLKFAENTMVETVLMHYEREKSRNRNTLCVSTQAGCAMQCKFCASAINGLERNLTSGEIIEQVNFANAYLKKKNQSPVTNVVFMGMGEPLHNFDAVMKAIEILNKGKNIGMRRMTISTAGVVPQIRRLTEQNQQITLAVSLHAPNDKLRSYLMPINNKYPLVELMAVLDDYISRTNRRVTIEYALFKGINDSISTAEELASLLSGKLVNVNLISGNPVAGIELIPSEPRDVNMFAETLINRGIEVIVRESRGQEINGACGQLRREQIINDK